jgi:hypothetical protein
MVAKGFATLPAIAARLSALLRGARQLLGTAGRLSQKTKLTSTMAIPLIVTTRLQAERRATHSTRHK